VAGGNSPVVKPVGKNLNLTLGTFTKVNRVRIVCVMTVLINLQILL